jgi:hypothetical protein
VFKKAHLSGDDFRVFDGSSGRPVAVLHHFGKNPYEKLDPLSLGNFSDRHEHMVSCGKHQALSFSKTQHSCYVATDLSTWVETGSDTDDVAGWVDQR